MPKNPQVYMDITIGSKAAGRVVFELFSDITPKTAENFRGLNTGDYGYGKDSKKKLHYLGSRFHRVIEGFMIQGGDISNSDGSGGESIYGKYFADENFSRRHAHAGLLSMANHGRDTNSSQFFVTLRACPHLDGNHVVFGQVVDGMDVIRKIEKVQTDSSDRPRIPITIFDCGEIDDNRIHLRNDEFKSNVSEFIKQNEERIKHEHEEAERTKAGIVKKPKVVENNEEIVEEKEEQEEPEVDDSVINLNKADKKLNKDQADKLFELRLKMNEARKQNNKAVLEEKERLNDPDFEKKRKRREWREEEQEMMSNLKEKGLTEEKRYLNDTAAVCERNMIKRKEKKKNSNFTFGWDVFNDDSLYKAYHKRVDSVPFDKELYETQKKSEEAGAGIDSESRKQLLVDDIEKQLENRKKFSRRRMFMDEKDVDYINERNKVFNEKISRHFDKYASSIKASLERGTSA